MAANPPGLWKKTPRPRPPRTLRRTPARRFRRARSSATWENPVLNGEPNAGPEVCHWNTESPELVSVLLTIRAKGSIREEALCSGLRQTGGEGKRLQGLGDVAVWKFFAGSLFNSGDLEACGPRAFVSISLNGKADESKLKQAAVELVGRVMGS